MKHILITIFLVLFIKSNSQNNLEFNKVIDTILVSDFGGNAASMYNYAQNEGISPPTGKVWKIQSIQINEIPFNGDFISCNSGGDYSSSGLRATLIIEKGENFMPLCMFPFDVQQGGAVLPPLTCDINYPLWVNSGSTIYPVLHHYLNGGCFEEENTLKVYFSMIEFNVNTP